MMTIVSLRQAYHASIRKDIIRVFPPAKAGRPYPNLADGSNRSSIDIAWKIVEHLDTSNAYEGSGISGQTVGNNFEDATRAFLESAFSLLQHLRPGHWYYSTKRTDISHFDQYHHLAYLADALKKDPKLETMLGANSDYVVTPDIIVARWPVTDDEINSHGDLIDGETLFARHTRLRSANHDPVYPILHASISCKWTIRRDRTQNTRTEALNLIRNRQGSLPHIAAVTAEPLPSRIAAIALGTGDLDCVYHFALPELRAALVDLGKEDQLDMLDVMIDGMRLRDISDLPFDLAV
jgi:hypothetical protein